MWVDVLRIINSVGALAVVLLLLTMPRRAIPRPSMWFLAYSLAMYSAATAYGSIALMGDPSILRPVMVFVAMSTSLVGVVLVRRDRLGYVVTPRKQARHAAATPTRENVRAA